MNFYIQADTARVRASGFWFGERVLHSRDHSSSLELTRCHRLFRLGIEVFGFLFTAVNIEVPANFLKVINAGVKYVCSGWLCVVFRLLHAQEMFSV